jgi:hypothetical protein
VWSSASFGQLAHQGGNDEFIEIFNPTQNPIDISGWKIRRSPGTGSDPADLYNSFPTNTFIQAGQYILIARSGDYSGTVTPDYIFTSATGIADNGGIALTLSDNTIIDQVGMSSVTVYGEGTRLSAITSNTDWAYLRNPDGTEGVCFDYNNNDYDFVLIDPSQPRNSSSPFTPCPSPTPTPEWQNRIIINEVAWGGTRADDTLAQWIELYNPGNYVDLEGNKCFLRIPNKPDVELKGAIPAGSYYLIERNQADTSVTTYTYPISDTPTPIDTPTSPAVISVPGMTIAFPLMEVTGDSLRLYCGGATIGTGQLVDSANANGGPWPAGNRFFDYHSMERVGPPYGADSNSAWRTFDRSNYAGIISTDRFGNDINGSPGQPNSPGLVSTPTPTPTSTFTLTLTPTPTLTLTPTLTHTPSGSRSVIINEIAWMGTIASDADEWIELYNPGTSEINITGWKLIVTSSNTSSSFTINLNGTISSGGYFFL